MMIHKHGLFDLNHTLIDFETVGIQGVSQGEIDSE